MKHAQVININDDAVMAFIGDNVLEVGTQLPFHTIDVYTLLVDMKLWDLMSNAPVVIAGISMIYHIDAGYWTVDIDGSPSIKDILQDRHKYVGSVWENTLESENLIPFQITEFAVDNESLDDILMRMSYEIVIDGGQADFFWYQVGHHGEEAYRKFTAPAYEGGVGSTYATDPSRVTHRGAIVPYFVV